MDKYEEFLDKELGVSTRRKLQAKVNEMSFEEMRVFIRITIAQTPATSAILIDKIMALRDKVNA